MPDVKSVWNAGLCSGIHVFAGWTEMRSCIKIFRQNEEETKKIKKRCFFLPAMKADGSQGLREKNTLFEEQRRKGRFFPKQPEGLDLDGLGYQG